MGFREINKLDQIMDGAVSERFNQALSQILLNCYDPNTNPVKARKIALEFVFVPNQARDGAIIKYDIKVTLAQPAAIMQTVFLTQGKSGEIVAVERTDQEPGQIDMDGKETPVPNMVTFNAPASAQK